MSLGWTAISDTVWLYGTKGVGYTPNFDTKRPTMCGYGGQRDAQPAYFFFCAGQAAIDRRRASQAAREARGGVPSPTGEVLPGAYVGQLLLSTAGGAPESRMNEDEFVRHLEVSQGALVNVHHHHHQHHERG